MKSGTIQVDRAGRMVLPKPLRDLFNLLPGDKLKASVEGNAIRLEPARAGGELELKGSVLVFSGAMTRPVTTSMVNQLTDQDRGGKPKRLDGKRRGK